MSDYARMDAGMLSTRELAEMLGVDVETILAWASKGRIPALRISAKRRYVRSDVIEALNVLADARAP